MKKQFNLSIFMVAVLFWSHSAILAAGPIGKCEVSAKPYGESIDSYLSSAGLILRENLLYMTFSSSSYRKKRSLVVVDVSNPEKLRLMNETPIPGFPQALAISGKHLYLVNGVALLVFDISVGSKPKLLKSLTINSNPLFGPQGIALKNNFAYLACRKTGIVVIDIAIPVNPQQVACLKTSGLALGVTVNKDCLYVADDTKGICVVDISAPAKLAISGKYKTASGTTRGVIVRENKAYLADGFHMLKILDVSDPLKPRLLGTCANRGVLAFFGSFTYGLTLADPVNCGSRRIAYLADGESGVQAIDITDPKNPKLAGALMSDMGMGGPYDIRAITKSGKYLFCNDDNYGLRILKIETPAAPHLAGPGLKLR